MTLRPATLSLHAAFLADHPLAPAYRALRGVRIRDLSEPDTYVVSYGPARPASTLVLLHGTEGYAQAAVALWAPLVGPRVRLLAIQWWDGADYLDDDRLVEAIGKARRLVGVAGPYDLAGYSRAGSRIPALAARLLTLPAASRPRAYLMESASADRTYPGTADLVARAAERPLLGVRIAVAGGLSDGVSHATAERLRATVLDLASWGSDVHLRLVPGGHGALTADAAGLADVLDWMAAG